MADEPRPRAYTARELKLRAELIELRHSLQNLLGELEPKRDSEPAQSAVVTAVVVQRAPVLKRG